MNTYIDRTNVILETDRLYLREVLVENVVCNVENPMKYLCKLREKFSCNINI